MSLPHTILELRTSRDAQHTPESAVQLFSSLPNIRNMWFWRILGKSESISFEIIVENQTIYFQVYVPVRLITYVKSILVSSYPEIVIKEIEHDAVDSFINPKPTIDTNQEYFLETGSLRLRQAEYLSIKTYKEFHDVDSLSPILSTLSKLEEHDKVVLQYIVTKSSNRITSPITTTTNSEGVEIEKNTKGKEKSAALKVAIRMAVATVDKQRSYNLLENLSSAYEALSDHNGNSLGLKRTYLFKKRFVKHMKARDYKSTVSFHLSLEEMATLMHLPSEKLTNIPNIAWGKNLLGEPPEDLPIKTRDMDSDQKKRY